MSSAVCCKYSKKHEKCSLSLFLLTLPLFLSFPFPFRPDMYYECEEPMDIEDSNSTESNVTDGDLNIGYCNTVSVRNTKNSCK